MNRLVSQGQAYQYSKSSDQWVKYLRWLLICLSISLLGQVFVLVSLVHLLGCRLPVCSSWGGCTCWPDTFIIFLGRPLPHSLAHVWVVGGVAALLAEPSCCKHLFAHICLVRLVCQVLLLLLLVTPVLFLVLWSWLLSHHVVSRCYSLVATRCPATLF